MNGVDLDLTCDPGAADVVTTEHAGVDTEPLRDCRGLLRPRSEDATGAGPDVLRHDREFDFLNGQVFTYGDRLGLFKRVVARSFAVHYVVQPRLTRRRYLHQEDELSDPYVQRKC